MGFLRRLIGLEQPASLAERQRATLVRALITPPCPLCKAEPGTGCDRHWPVWAEMIRLDRYPPLLIHTIRAATAVRAHPAIRRQLLAQFGDGPAPAALTRKTP